MRRIAASGRKVALIGVENAYPIGEDLRRVKEFYDRGGRYMSLAHNGNNQMSDSNTGERDGYTWKNGISPMGERGHRRDEPARHHDRRVASVKGVDAEGGRH